MFILEGISVKSNRFYLIKKECMQLDAIDKQILKLLEQDGKMVAKTIAEQLGLTKTPVYDRIRRLEKEGFIKRYAAILDKEKIAESITVFSFVSLEVQKAEFMDQFIARIQDFPEVVECFVVGGEFDFLLKVMVKDLDAYYTFAKQRVATLPNIGAVKSAFGLKEAKQDYRFPLL
ncbi:Lrp/AsnC family transcriptional regulator [Croceivirga sp. JEA036]|nr:Lrp/AsnC family transcriptional regulator [Croceivirga sp. JEA036]